MFCFPLYLTKYQVHWPCYCTVHVDVVTPFCGNMWSLWVIAKLGRFMLSFVYICICIVVGDPVISLTGLTPPYFCACPMPWIGFLLNVTYRFLFFYVSNELRCEVVVCFVDIGGIVDHHCYLILNNIIQRFLKNRLILYFKTLCGRYQLLVGRGRRSRNRMVIGFTPTCAISTYHH